jgi:hypothetical protein
LLAIEVTFYDEDLGALLPHAKEEFEEGNMRKSPQYTLFPFKN